MPKSKTHFPQVPVEIAEKVAQAEANGHAAVASEAPSPKKVNGHGSKRAQRDEGDDV